MAEYAATNAGLQAAITAATDSSDTIQIPSMTITGDLTIGKSCTIIGYGAYGAPNSGISGKVTVTTGIVKIMGITLSSASTSATLEIGAADVYLDGVDIINSNGGRCIYLTSASALTKFENVAAQQSASSALPCAEITCASTSDNRLNEWTGSVVIQGDTTAYSFKMNAGLMLLKDTRISNIGTGNNAIQVSGGTLYVEDVQYALDKVSGTVTQIGGDRATVAQESYHADDILASAPTRHNPWPAAVGTVPVSDGSKWVAQVVSTVGALDDLSDVDTSGVADGDILVYDSGTATWYAVSGSDATLNDLTDVDTTGVATGDILVKTAGGWEDRRQNIRKVTTITGDTVLDDTYEVVVVDATAGDIDIDLPLAASNDGLHYYIKRIDSSANIVTIQAAVSVLADSTGDPMTDSDGVDLYDSDGSGTDDTIDGEIEITLDQYSSMQIVADADADSWWIL